MTVILIILFVMTNHAKAALTIKHTSHHGILRLLFRKGMPRASAGSVGVAAGVLRRAT